MARSIKLKQLTLGGRAGLFLIAGPCVIESREKCLRLAGRLKTLAEQENIPLIFKASYDKANRTALKSFRGPGISQGLDILQEVKAKYDVPILTDVHTEQEVSRAAAVADILQLPAFLCRQTDLVCALGESGKIVNIKKGQFLAAADVAHIVTKVESTGNRKILITERGNSFGYNTLVADMRNLVRLKDLGYPVIFDATHSVQQPGGAGGYTAGEGALAPPLARAAVATGCDGIFLETHLKPAEALSDKENAIPFSKLSALWRQMRAIDDIVKK